MSRASDLRQRNSEKRQREEQPSLVNRTGIESKQTKQLLATACCGQSAPVKRPGFVKRVKTYTTAQMRYIADGSKDRSQEEQAANLSICGQCPLLGADGVCDGCGCPVADKVQLRLEECPAGKWFADLHPVRPLIDPVRHLLHCCLPVASSEMWRWNLDQLAQRQDVFNGQRTLAIIHEPNDDDFEHRVRRKIAGEYLRTVEPDEVLSYCDEIGLRFDAWQVFGNIPRLGEVVAFPWLLESVESLAVNEITFYSHSKGVTRTESDLKRWPARMYRVCLDDLPTVERALERASFAGCFFREKSHGRSSWHPSGTFGWYRSADLYSRKTWRDIEQEYYGTEAYWGTQFKRHEAICLSHDKAGNVYADEEWATVIQPQIDIWEAARQ